mgnify:CR=1 FL=1
MKSTVINQLYDQKWDKTATMEYQRASQFTPYIGRGASKPIVLRNMDSQTDNVPFVPDVQGKFVNGDNRAKGNGRAMQTYHEQVTAEWLRFPIEYTKRTASFASFDVRGAAKDSVVNFNKNGMRTRLIDASLSVRNSTAAGANSPYGVIEAGTYGPEITSSTRSGASITTIEGEDTVSADETTLDGWLGRNSDRVLFGSLRSNNSANDHSASLSNIDATDDTPRKSNIKLLHQMAKLANPKIHPFMLKNDKNGGFQEWYLYLVGSRGFGQFSDDPEIIQANASARERGLDNPLFTGGELLVDGVIIKQVEEMPVITGVGASSIDVGVGVMWGNQAIAYGSYQEMRSIVDVDDDYEFVTGICSEVCDTFKKIFFNGKQHGMLTHYFAAPAAG